MPYDNHYGIPLLDDVHNYFPALLYDPVRFQNVGDVFAYVRQQMHRRFDLFSSAQAAYRSEVRRQPRAAAAPPTVFHRQPRFAAAAAAPVPEPQTPPLRPSLSRTVPMWNAMQTQPGMHPAIAEYTLETLMGGLLPSQIGGNQMGDYLSPIFSNSLSALLNGVRQPAAAQQALQEPVIVAPTEQQVAAATAIEIVADDDEVCAICQEGMASGTEARSLNACDHMFHTGCIDTWFQRNVRCPVCRHDIRDIVETPVVAVATGEPTAEPTVSENHSVTPQ
jgi:hypothetical protein